MDHSGKYNAATLAAHLDHLEVLHFLDLRGADLNNGVGSMENTPLMSALMNWNVRIIDYLTERGVDPFVKDKFGFTASRKAKIKKLNTIYSMLASYETRYEQLRMKAGSAETLGAITSKDWEAKLNKVDIKDYTVVTVADSAASFIDNYKPSNMLMLGEYPFSNMEDNQLIMTVAGNFHYFNSADDKQVL